MNNLHKTAAYDEEAHAAVRNFWRNLPANHPFSKHPILSRHGDELSRSAYEFTIERARRSGINVGNNPRQMQELMMQTFQTFQQIESLEQAHQQQLVELAKDITVRIWGIPREMLDGEITPDTAIEGDDAPPPNMVDVTPQLQDQINKRLTLNTMTQGSAVHAYLSMHHLVDQAINAISPQLLQLYNRLTAGSTGVYWLIDIPRMMASMGGAAAAGDVRIIRENKSNSPNQQQEDSNQSEEVKIKAKAKCFPVLCQEFSKGVMEFLSLQHGGLHQLKEDELATVYYHADRMEDEPWLIQVGPELWRRFLAVLPQGAPLAAIIAALAKKSPQTVNTIVGAVVSNPQNSRRLIDALLKEVSPPEEDSF